MTALRHPGVQAALAAALLFGLATPLAKLLLVTINPFLLAGLLYLGSGLGLSLWRRVTSQPSASLPRPERRWFLGAIFFGGILGPVLLMLGLRGMGASQASLLLNAEGVLTALIAWFIFRENFDRRIALGMAAITAGAVLLATSGGLRFADLVPSALVLGACLAWGIDNNLTRRVSLTDASWIACVKGLVAGLVNTTIALTLGAKLPDPLTTLAVLTLGFFAYGVSLTLFVRALRDLGTARAGAYFAVAPFFGAAFAVLLGDPITVTLILAAALMALGVWLHLTEHHAHEHDHDPLEHAHMHDHGLHHLHDHPFPVASGTRHSHMHRHDALTHTHPHYPDAHHRHSH